MNYMIIMAGIWIAILPYVKWSDIGKKLSFLHTVIGLYTCSSIIAYIINSEVFGYIWVQIAYGLICILLVIEIIIKVKRQAVILDIIAVVTSIVGLILSIVVFLAEPMEISSAIIMVTSPMIILSIPFYKIGVKNIKIEK
ncbi:MAG: hypothetical protein SPL51_07655 [Lachnospiraceae bacterium]|nr:hypothetical protein [Lachnospiraceae bacterium]